MRNKMPFEKKKVLYIRLLLQMLENEEANGLILTKRQIRE
jgi:hypothetical protein